MRGSCDKGFWKMLTIRHYKRVLFFAVYICVFGIYSMNLRKTSLTIEQDWDLADVIQTTIALLHVLLNSKEKGRKTQFFIPAAKL